MFSLDKFKSLISKSLEADLSDTPKYTFPSDKVDISLNTSVDQSEFPPKSELPLDLTESERTCMKKLKDKVQSGEFSVSFEDNDKFDAYRRLLQLMDTWNSIKP